MATASHPYELSAEHEAFRASVRDFAQQEVAPHVAEWDKKHHFPSDLVKKMGEYPSNQAFLDRIALAGR